MIARLLVALQIVAGSKGPKRSVPPIQEQQIRLARFPAGEEFRIVVDIPRSDEDILPAVVVEVVDAGAPPAQSDAGRTNPAAIRDVAEQAIPFIPVERKCLVRQSGQEHVLAGFGQETANQVG